MADFKPTTDGTLTINAEAASARAAVRTNADPNQPVRVLNAGVSIVFIKRGTVAVTASTNDMPIYPGAPPEVIPLEPGDTHIAAATTSTSCKLYLTPGSFVRG